MITVQKLIQDWTARFQAQGLGTAQLDARALVLFVCGLSREEIIADPARPVSEAECLAMTGLGERRLGGEPVAYLTGKKEFWSLEFQVTSDTLIPRPDSETLVLLGLEAMPESGKAYRILDLGTGSGCLLLAMLSERAEARGLGVDISEGAVKVAQFNAQALGMAGRADFCQGNWTEGLEGSFDVIVSNPPYIADGDREVSSEVRAFEPASALFGGADGLDPLRAQVGGVRDLLTKNGSYIMEYGQGQTENVSQILRSAGFEILEIRRDLAGIERAIMAKVAKM
ncbi:MAG: peptide chain release factor N(5)-glutamine methyltransferase [Alphaproteobacteria bacterium]|nr:MAG: peptide chain release factor N(5)-glutamine methyltransferase [Alphaproteobacteria bacterium]